MARVYRSIALGVKDAKCLDLTDNLVSLVGP